MAYSQSSILVLIFTLSVCFAANNELLHDPLELALIKSIQQAQESYNVAMNLSNAMLFTEELYEKQNFQSPVEDCIELFEDTIQQLKASSHAISHMRNHTSFLNDRHGFMEKFAHADVQTWLSAALTNQDACMLSIRQRNVSDGAELTSHVNRVSRYIAHSLNVFTFWTHRKHMEFSKPSPHSRRRLLEKQDQFPSWISPADRRLLRSESLAERADMVVAKDGSGKFSTISSAIAAVPKRTGRERFVIYVKAGIYKENVRIPKKMTNILLLGAGQGATVVTGDKNYVDGSTTFNSATFAVSGDGFMARDITFQNTAGPSKHQAVALRVGSDRAVIYRCTILGFQDSLYAFSLRQFYRECDIHGTVDFIFGNAAAVFQNCNVYCRRPMNGQYITVTAQGRTDPNQNTGFSFQRCTVDAERGTNLGTIVYLGRPWRAYSRVVWMQSYLGAVVNGAGWHAWLGGFALKTLFYGEYANTGPGASTAHRVKWPGFHVIRSAQEAAKFSVSAFIAGDAWLPSTGVPFARTLS